MLPVFIIYLFLLGLIVGSFLNVVILRFNTGRGIGGRSGCMTCKRTLSWFELIPVVSWIMQLGRCRGCRTKISVQYPLVELVTGVLFAGNFFYIFTQVQSYLELIIYTLITTLMWIFFIIVFVYDLRHKIIPDVFSFTLWGIAIVFTVSSRACLGISWLYCETPKQVRGDMNFLFNDIFLQTGLHILAGLFFYSCIWVLWKVSKGTWIGLGDAKLLLSIGTVLGFVYGLSAIFVAFWIGTFFAIILLLKQRLSKNSKHITMKTEIPFGPFLIVGFAIVYFTGIDVTNVGILLEYYAT